MSARNRFSMFATAIATIAALGSCAPQNVRGQDLLVQNPSGRPEVLRDVGLDQKLGAQVPLDATFRDEHGASVTIGQLLQGKPAILTLVYYQCPMLCTEVLNATLNSLKEVPLEIGKDFSVITVSIDPSERPVLAEAKQIMYTGLYGRPGAVLGWHFLTGDDAQIHRLAAAVGFRYAYDATSKQFAHASGIMLLTPEGKLSRYFYGISYRPRDVRLGLVEASEGKIGSLTDTILLYCYHYDPSTGKYGVVITNVVRAAGLLTVAALALMVIYLLRRERRIAAASAAGESTHRGTA
ncbi:MAG TPA: SCO family protein [Candidatus Acidoferrales bacterium]|nr:SCO family protein [Candidatus Acidoferrales bacterium]